MGEFDRQSRYRKRKTAERGEIPGLPPVADPERREACRFDLLLDLETYYPHTTGLKPFSEAQKSAIKRIELSLLEGDARVLNAFPRGFGKTTISENAAIWGLKYGHCKFVPIIGADKTAADDNIDSIKTEWMTNDLLLADFPEVAIPFRRLENKAQRCQSQTHNDELTHIGWNADEIVQAYIRDKDGRYLENSGGAVRALGLTARLRGMGIKRPDGTKQRPDWWILDDPQTDESARSPAQCRKRLSLFQKAVLRLGGHTRLLAGVINATVIEVDDMIDELLDHKKHPEVEGLRIAMLKSMSEAHESFWLGEYAEIRRTYNPEDPYDRRRAIREANEHYLLNRERADAGAAATWEHCFAEEDGEISAIQHAYNILIDDGEEVFASECQNQPIRIGYGNSDFLSSQRLQAERVDSWSLRSIPRECEVVGWHIDVQKKCLYYTVLAASDDWTIRVLEYGIYPQQRSRSLEYKRVRTTLARKYPGCSEEKRIEFAVSDLCRELMDRQYTRSDSTVITPVVGLVDAGDYTDAVKDGVALTGLSEVYSTFGQGKRAKDTPMLQVTKKKGERRSKDPFVPWRMLKDTNRSDRRNVFTCTNSIKTFLHRRIATDKGAAGSFSLPKGNHREFADAVCNSEYPTELEGPWGTVLEWDQYPSRPENHLFDTTVGAIAAISISGRVLYGQQPVRKKSRRRRVSYL